MAAEHILAWAVRAMRLQGAGLSRMGTNNFGDVEGNTHQSNSETVGLRSREREEGTLPGGSTSLVVSNHFARDPPAFVQIFTLCKKELLALGDTPCQ